MEISKAVQEYLNKANYFEVRQNYEEELKVLQEAREKAAHKLINRKYNYILTLADQSIPDKSLLEAGWDNDLYWAVDADGLLIVAGNGNYANYSPDWCRCWKAIRKAILDITDIDSTERIFYNCIHLKEADLSHLETGNVYSMRFMFDDCQSLETLDLSNFDTSQVKYMNYMFTKCYKLSSVNLSSFNTSQVVDMSCMFEYCQSLTSLDLNAFDTSQVTDMSCMFEYCQSLTNLDLNAFDTSQVKNMYQMFDDCKALTELNLKGFDTSKVGSMFRMFNGCKALTRLDLTDFTSRPDIQLANMFHGCFSLPLQNLKASDNRIILQYREDIENTVMARVYELEVSHNFAEALNLLSSTKENAGSDLIHKKYNFIASLMNQAKTSRILQSGKNGNLYWSIDDQGLLLITGNGSYKGEYMNGYPSWMKYSSLIQAAIVDATNVTHALHMFDCCSNLKSIDLSQLNTSKITNTCFMFSHCSLLTSLKLPPFRNVTGMNYMFGYCTSLTSLDISGIHTSENTALNNMFISCPVLTDLKTEDSRILEQYRKDTGR